MLDRAAGCLMKERSREVPAGGSSLESLGDAMKRLLALSALLMLAGCTRTYDSGELKVHYKPPRGVKLVEEQAGPPHLARFSSGLEIRSFDGEPVAIEEEKLEGLLAQIDPAATGSVISARIGTLPPGKAVRWTIKDGETRRLVYYLPAKGRYLVLSLSAPDARYMELETDLELSLASLRLRE